MVKIILFIGSICILMWLTNITPSSAIGSQHEGFFLFSAVHTIRAYIHAAVLEITVGLKQIVIKEGPDKWCHGTVAPSLLAEEYLSDKCRAREMDRGVSGNVFTQQIDGCVYESVQQCCIKQSLTPQVLPLSWIQWIRQPFNYIQIYIHGYTSHFLPTTPENSIHFPGILLVNYFNKRMLENIVNQGLINSRNPLMSDVNNSTCMLPNIV